MAGSCEDKVALVTGASRGIGAAIAQRLASEGARVAAVARSLDTHPPKLPGTLRETVATIRSRGGTAVAIQGDVMDAASRRRFVEECRRALGPIDILVNNAAHGPYRRFLDFSERDFRETIEANLHAPFELCQQVLPDMIGRKRGWIVNISSATAFHPAKPPYIEWERSGGYHLYATSKAALDRMTTGLAAEFYADGVAVNALAPVAAVITPGVEATDVGRWIAPEMIEPVEAMAEAALALASGDPAVLTGRVVYSGRFLGEIGREVRTLDGRAPYRA